MKEIIKVNKHHTKHYGMQDLQNVNIKNLAKSLNSNLITNGLYCKKFEDKISKVTKSKYTVVCNNGTSALMMAILSLISNKEIIAIVPNINFVATANIIKLLKGKLVLCDVDESTGMVNLKTFNSIIKLCDKKKIKPNLFIPIHYAGNVANLKKINKLCKLRNIKVIEDGCHSFGSMKKFATEKTTVGECKYSNLTTFSFHPVKNITTIEGGAITTNNKVLYKKLLLLRSHSLKKTNISDPYKVIETSSLNFRLGEINALIGIKQIENISYSKKKRNRLIEKYLKNIKKLNKIFESINFPNSNIFWHIFVIKINKEFLKKKKNLMKYLVKNSIGCQVHYKPICNHKSYKKIILLNQNKNSQNFYKSQLTLPLHNKINFNDVNYIINKITIFFKLKL